jgi:hypothetical protein
MIQPNLLYVVRGYLSVKRKGGGCGAPALQQGVLVAQPLELAEHVVARPAALPAVWLG